MQKSEAVSRCDEAAISPRWGSGLGRAVSDRPRRAYDCPRGYGGGTSGSGAVAAPTSTGMRSRGAPTGVGPGHEAQPEAIRCLPDTLLGSAIHDPGNHTRTGIHDPGDPTWTDNHDTGRCHWSGIHDTSPYDRIGRIIGRVCVSRPRQRGSSNKADAKPGQACAESPTPAGSTPAPAAIAPTSTAPAPATMPAAVPATTVPAPGTRGCRFWRKRDSTHRSESSERKREFPHHRSPVTQRGRNPPCVKRPSYRLAPIHGDVVERLKTALGVFPCPPSAQPREDAPGRPGAIPRLMMPRSSSTRCRPLVPRMCERHPRPS